MKDIETKDDPEYKFDDDDSMLAAMLPDSVTKPTENPSSADAFTVLGNPVQRLPRSTETNPNSSQASLLPLQPHVNIDQSPGQSGHTPDASTPVPQVNIDQSPGQSGRISEPGIEAFSLRVLSVYFIFQSCDMKIIAPKEEISLKPSPFKVLVIC